MEGGAAGSTDRFWTAANAVTLARLALAPVMLVLAYMRLPSAFLVVLASSLVADVVDGKVALWLGQSAWGARLESWADLVTCACVPLAAYWLHPDLLASEAASFWAIVAAFAVPVTFAFIRYGTLTSYHTHGAAVAAYLVGGAAIVLFAGGPTWPLRIAAAALVAAELEEIAITAVLPRPVSMVRTLRAALRLRRERFADALDE